MISRYCSLGGEWVFLKVYVGETYVDNVLSHYLYPVSLDSYKEGLIDMFFFIRYKDEFGPHIRYRFHLRETKLVGELIVRIYSKMNDLIVQHRIVKLEYDTYVREMERYGVKTYESIERLFFYDSKAILELISNGYLMSERETRWMIGLALVDDLLDVFHLSDEERLSFLKNSMDGYRQELRCDNAPCIHNHNKRYRDKCKEIVSALNREFPDRIKEILEYRKQQIREQLMKIRSQIDYVTSIGILLSIIHMTVNRLFESDNRKCEMVLYEFLYKSLESELAKRRYIANLIN